MAVTQLDKIQLDVAECIARLKTINAVTQLDKIQLDVAACNARLKDIAFRFGHTPKKVHEISDWDRASQRVTPPLNEHVYFEQLDPFMGEVPGLGVSIHSEASGSWIHTYSENLVEDPSANFVYATPYYDRENDLPIDVYMDAEYVDTLSIDLTQIMWSFDPGIDKQLVASMVIAKVAREAKGFFK